MNDPNLSYSDPDEQDVKEFADFNPWYYIGMFFLCLMIGVSLVIFFIFIPVKLSELNTVIEMKTGIVILFLGTFSFSVLCFVLWIKRKF